MNVKRESLILGIDGGGTKMTGCLLNGEGRILAYREQPPAIYAKLQGQIVQPIQQLLLKLFEDAGVTNRSVAIAGICSTGIGRPRDREIVTQALNAARIAEHVVVDSDAAGALAGAFAGGPGIIVNAGTGSFAVARTDSGELVRVGGWGYLIGDEGSGFALARNALNAALQDWDGRGEKTALRSMFEKHFGVESIDLAISQIYAPDFDRGQMARLSPLIFGAAEQGDSVAARLIRETGFELGRHVMAAVHRFGSAKRIALSLMGNLFRRETELLPSFWEALGKESSRIDVVQPRFEAVIGAALLALLSFGDELDDVFLKALESSSQGLRAAREHQQ